MLRIGAENFLQVAGRSPKRRNFLHCVVVGRCDAGVSARIARENKMLRHAGLAAITAAFSLLLSACGETPGQRAVTGGAMGAAGGAAVGAATGNTAGGAVVGGLGGAAVGAATAPN
jgi:osmotically inducible lipoprotein OsmB